MADGKQNTRRTISTDKVEPVYMGETAKIRLDKDWEVEISAKQMEEFDNAVRNPELNWKTKVRRVINGSTETSKYIGTAIDLIVAFTPFRKPINRLRSLVKRQVKNKTTMGQETTNKIKSPQLWGFALLFIYGLLMKFTGLDLGLEMSPDAEWVWTGGSVLMFFFRLITGKPVKVGRLLKRLQDNPKLD